MRSPCPGKRCGRLLGHCGEPATPSGREPPRAELPQWRSCPRHRRGHDQQDDGDDEDRAAQHVQLRHPPGPLSPRFRGDKAVSLHDRDECLCGLGQADQMHPAGHVTVRDALRSDLLRRAQRGRSRRYEEPKLADVTAKALGEFLHVAGALRQRRVLVQHERHRLRRSRRPIALRNECGADTALPPQGNARVSIPTGRQRQAHDTTPLHLRPTGSGRDWYDAWCRAHRGPPSWAAKGSAAYGALEARGTYFAVDHPTCLRGDQRTPRRKGLGMTFR